MLIDDIKLQILKAIKERDSVRLETLKMLSTSLNNAEIAKKRQKLTEEEEIAVVQREAKKRKDAIDAYMNAGAADRADKERAELKILEMYLPDQLSQDDVLKVVTEEIEKLGGKTKVEFGLVMSSVMSKVRGRADGKLVSELVKSVLS